MICLSFATPVKEIDSSTDLQPIDYSGFTLTYIDIVMMVISLLGIFMGLIALYKKEKPNWLKYFVLALNSIWFFSYLILIA